MLQYLNISFSIKVMNLKDKKKRHCCRLIFQLVRYSQLLYVHFFFYLVKTSSPSHLTGVFRENKLCLTWEAPLPFPSIHLTYEVSCKVRAGRVWMVSWWSIIVIYLFLTLKTFKTHTIPSPLSQSEDLCTGITGNWLESKTKLIDSGSTIRFQVSDMRNNHFALADLVKGY